MAVMTDISRENLPLAEELRTYPSVERWLKEKVPKTQTNYLANMIKFTKATGQTPDQFLQWARTVDPVEVKDQISKIADGLTDSVKYNFKIDMKSFLTHSGYNNLPKEKLTYQSKEWHPEYSKDEVRKLVGFLDKLPEKLYVYMAVETGFRARTVLAIRYKHIAQDYEAGIIPVAIRLGPEFYGKKKSAGFTFLGERSVQLIREGIKNGLIKTKPESPLVTIGYDGIYNRLTLAAEKAGVNPEIQPNHGFRKYFDEAVNRSNIPEQKRNLLKGRFVGVQVKHYTSRDWDELRKLYREAYPQIDIDSTNPELATKIVSQEDEISNMKQRLTKMESLLQELLKKRGPE